MASGDKHQRLAELQAEIQQLEAFIAAIDRGEHDDEAAIAAAAATLPSEKKRFFGSKKDDRSDRIRELRRNSLKLQAFNRMNKEIYPEIHQLRFELGLMD